MRGDKRSAELGARSKAKPKISITAGIELQAFGGDKRSAELEARSKAKPKISIIAGIELQASACEALRAPLG